MKYIQSSTTGHESGCIFCEALAKEDGPGNLVIVRGKAAFVMLNLFPYTNGHLMVAPMNHQAQLDELDADARAEMMELVSRGLVVLKKVYNPNAFNLGANIGQEAGAGVPGHVHLHIVPRWAGDTNFMSTVGEVRVLPETIDDSYKRIRAAWLQTFMER